MRKITTRNKVFIAGGLICIIVLAVGGVLWHNHQQHNKQLAAAKVAADFGQSASSGAAGLSVSGSGADNLGQLGNSPSQGSNSNSSGNSSGSSSGSSSGNVDPSTFGQYNKYQNSQNALFGDIQVGSGAELAVGQKANIYYKVWLTNGALVDQSPVSSSGQPQPFSFTLGAHQVILGLEQGIAGMKVGGQRLVIVPPVVGYGSQGQGAVPPNAVLVFEVQLLSAQ